MEHGTVENEQDEEDDWHGAGDRFLPALWPTLADYFRDILRIIGEDGQPSPPQGGPEVLQRGAREEFVRELVRIWWPGFFRTTTEQYQESIRRARAVITTPRVPPPEADMNYWSPYPYLQLSVSEPINPEEVDPQHLDNVVEVLATAFRTLSFREALAHSSLRISGAEARLSDLRPLSAEQEEELFREMERRGAFPEIDFARQYTRLSNRERWQVHREEDGESWNPDTRLWSPYWSD
ncbi:MAG: hypothetical protein Q9161_008069 [Pseudevernia consocians]